MKQKTAYLVDFDGTVTTEDISSKLAAYFGGKKYLEIEKEYRQRKIPIKVWLQRIAGQLPADFDLLKRLALEWAVIRPGFVPFLEKAAREDCPVVIASDGFGFYIEPILEEKGLLDSVSRIYRNELKRDGDALTVVNPYAHHSCPVCGNCKAAHAVRLKEEGRSVIYIGDGSNDRFGASWGDHVFARDRLAVHCAENNIMYSQWIDFYDIIKVEKPGLSDHSETALCLPMGRGIRQPGKGEVF
jgi:2,3-diketo-5-methylthio-1-phosphopentane phosphatase